MKNNLMNISKKNNQEIQPELKVEEAIRLTLRMMNQILMKNSTERNYTYQLL